MSHLIKYRNNHHLRIMYLELDLEKKLYHLQGKTKNNKIK